MCQWKKKYPEDHHLPYSNLMLFLRHSQLKIWILSKKGVHSYFLSDSLKSFPLQFKDIQLKSNLKCILAVIVPSSPSFRTRSQTTISHSHWAAVCWVGFHESNLTFKDIQVKSNLKCISAIIVPSSPSFGTRSQTTILYSHWVVGC